MGMGIKKCGLHALRRMNATQMDEQGVPLKTRQDRLGHAHRSTTLVHDTKPIEPRPAEHAQIEWD
jgi:integrase